MSSCAASCCHPEADAAERHLDRAEMFAGLRLLRERIAELEGIIEELHRQGRSIDPGKIHGPKDGRQ